MSCFQTRSSFIASSARCTAFINLPSFFISFVKDADAGAGQLATEHPRPAHSSLVKEDDMIVAWSQLPLAILIDASPEEAAFVRVIVHHGGPGREALNLRINQGAHREPDIFVLGSILLPTTNTRELLTHTAREGTLGQNLCPDILTRAKMTDLM